MKMVFKGIISFLFIFGVIKFVSSDTELRNILKLIPYVSSCDPAADCKATGAGTLVQDPQDCHNFFFCVTVNGEVVPSDAPIPCPEGKFFNPDTLICEEETEPCISTCGNSCSLTCTDSLDVVGFPGDCTKYYVCLFGGDTVLVDCPESAPYFDGTNCTTNKATCCDFCSVSCNTVGVQIADPFDCRMFYVCIQTGTPSEDTHLSCPAGQTFDANLGGCVDGTTCTPLCNNGSTTPVTTTLTPSTTSSGGDNCANSFTCTTDGNFPRCNFCDPSYFHCSGGAAEIRNCTSNTVFNTNPAFPYCILPQNCPFP